VLLALAGHGGRARRGPSDGRAPPAQEAHGRHDLWLRRPAQHRGPPALLETVAVETLGLENTIARNRALTTIVATGAKLLELGDLAARLAALEAALTSRHASSDDTAFPLETAG
jgi:hypothetical protein